MTDAPCELANLTQGVASMTVPPCEVVSECVQSSMLCALQLMAATTAWHTLTDWATSQTHLVMTMLLPIRLMPQQLH